MQRSGIGLSGIIFLIILLLGFNSNCAVAQDSRGTFGFGAMAGQPTGGTIKLWFNPRNALDGSFGWSLFEEEDDNVYLHLSYLRHKYNDINVARGLMPYYFGLGGFSRLGDNPISGVRIPFGLTYLFENDPLEIFVEVAPMIELTPSVVARGSYGLGIRYYPGQLRD
ncbi:MAG: hypothetical protein WD267_04850 [Balneolales bacterium]